ncbi:MAG: DMT family transporter [Lachnospiraceae bacterium]
MKTEFRSYVCIFIAGSLWGTIGLFVKLMEQAGSTSSYTSFLRMGLGLILLVIITLAKDGPKAFRIGKGTLLSCILLGFICQAIYNLAYSNAVNTIGVSLSSVLLYTSPIFTSVISFLFFHEKLGRRKLFALLINIIGCTLTVTGGNFNGLSFAASGLLFGIAAGFCYSLAPIFGRLAADEGSPFAVSTYNFLFATIFLAIFTHPWTTVSNPLNLKVLAIGVGFALVPTALGYIFYFSGLKNITESSKVPVVASIETVVATIIGILVFHENLRLGNILGIVCVLGSIAIMNLNFRQSSRPS